MLYRPELSERVRLRLRGGAFFPPVSLENDGPAWTSRYTITASAANSWIGEEVRTVGVDGTLVDNRGDRTVFDGKQYAWDTHFNAFGLHVELPGRVHLLGQYIGGATYMGRTPTPRQRIAVEVIRVESDRAMRPLLGSPLHLEGTLVEVSWRTDF